MADYPHISLPFRYIWQAGGQRLAVTDEDSTDEVADCVELILRTEQGQRRPDPGFGRPAGLLFTTDPDLSASMVNEAVDEYEPRVQALVEAGDIDPEDEGLLRLRAMYELLTDQDEEGDELA